MSEKTDLETNNLAANRGEVANVDSNRKFDPTDSTAHSEDLMIPFTDIINQMIYRQLANIMKSPEFRQEIIRDVKLMQNSELKDSDCDYIKKQDFQNAVDKLMSRTTIQTALALNQKMFLQSIDLVDDRLDTFEARLKTLEDRMKKPAIDNRDTLIKEVVQTTMEEMGMARSTTAAVSSKVISRVASKSKEVIVLLEPKKGLFRCSSSLENLTASRSLVSLKAESFLLPESKQRNYDKQVRIYDRRITIITSTGEVKRTLMSPSASKLVDEAFASYREDFKLPSVSNEFQPILQNEICLRIRQQYQRLLAERQLYRTNLLAYKKSSFTLNLNNQKDHFLNTLLESVDMKPKKDSQETTQTTNGQSRNNSQNSRTNNKFSKEDCKKMAKRDK